MPKGFTQEMLKYICDIVEAANKCDAEAAGTASSRLHDLLVADKERAIEDGVPAVFYDEAQKAEMTRALNYGFPTKDLGMQYRVEQAVINGNVDEVLGEVKQEPTSLQRAALYGIMGKSDLALAAAVEGIKELLVGLPSQYQVAGKTSDTICKVVAEASRAL